MPFLQLLKDRYTTKKYDSTKKLDSDKLIELQQILRLSPSSINSQPWQFTFVQNKAIKAQLSEVSWLNTSKVVGCDTVVVFSRINNIALFEEQIEKELAQGAVDYYKEFIQIKPEEEINNWFEKQVYLALGVFLSACAEMGIDSTPMEGIEPGKYDAILGLENYSTIVAVAIGKRDPEDKNQPSLKPKSRRDFEQIIKVV